MITFRFHLVSVIAVFLALALGVVVGSTLIDRAIVEGLETQVDDVQARLDERVGEVEAIRSDVADLEQYAEESAPWTTADQLTGTAVVVVAERGIDRGNVEELVVQARQAGASVPGVLWLNPSWVLDDETAREQVAEQLSLRNGDAVDVRARVWREVLNDLGTATLSDAEADELETASTATTETTLAPDTVPPETVPGDTVAPDTAPEGEQVPSDTAPSTTETVPPTSDSSGAITALTEMGLMEFEPFGSEARSILELDAGRLRVVLVGGPESELGDRGFVNELAALDVAESVPTLVAERFVERDEGPARGSLVSVIRNDDLLSARISTVDDLELVQGRVAVVLGLAELGRGVVGHFGYGDDATGVVPEWAPPPAG